PTGSRRRTRIATGSINRSWDTSGRDRSACNVALAREDQHVTRVSQTSLTAPDASSRGEARGEVGALPHPAIVDGRHQRRGDHGPAGDDGGGPIDHEFRLRRDLLGVPGPRVRDALRGQAWLRGAPGGTVDRVAVTRQVFHWLGIGVALGFDFFIRDTGEETG